MRPKEVGVGGKYIFIECFIRRFFFYKKKAESGRKSSNSIPLWHTHTDTYVPFVLAKPT